jgi:hypothetical protein
MNFIRKIAQNKVDADTHHAFIRYSMGEYPKEDFIIKKSSSGIKIIGGFEWVNVILKFTASLSKGDVELSGVVPTIKDISPILTKYGAQFETLCRYGKSGKRFDLKAKMSAEKALKLFDELAGCYILLDLNSEERQVKVKKKETPKIGSPAEKFVTASLSKDDLAKVKSEFLFDVDVKDFKQIVIKHTYNITEIDVDEKLLEKDPAFARQEAVRKGVVLRTIIIDGVEQKKEYKFSV